MFRETIPIALLIAAGAFGCGGSVPGARPQDMSAQQHEAVAAQEEREGMRHASQYNPDARAATVEDCAQYLGSCWKSNPTAEHREQAEGHQHAAAAHRTASVALRDAEARACQGVSERDRDVSPFFHREAIVEVKPLTRKVRTGRSYVQRRAGASVVLLPAPGVTAERLQRIVECHIARNASLGNDVPEMPYCPLVPKGVTATVTSVGNGFAVNIASENKETAEEVLRRARLLSPR
jgi:hypothetical protein